MSCRNFAVLALLVTAAACATKTPPPLPSPLRYADFLYPAVPPEMRDMPGAAGVDAGWRYLQNDDLRSAEREFAGAFRRSPQLYPAQAGEAYVAMAGRDYPRAETTFDAVLKTAPRYAPALAGRGQALLAQGRDAEALTSFEAALAADSSLSDLRRRVALLQFRNVQNVINTARAAADAGRIDEARSDYTRALQATPDSAFLHRELGMLERRAGNADAALEHLQRATTLDPTDSASLVQLGALLEARRDYSGAEAAYRKAALIESTPELIAKINAVAALGREAGLPAPFAAIPSAPAITRGELAALIGVRLDDLLRSIPPAQVVMTDTGGHWASTWIEQVARAGVMPPFEDHTFQPSAVVNRGELAAAVNRIVTVMASKSPDLRVRLSRRVQVTDMSPSHLSYPAVTVSVASGVLPLLPGDRFDVARPVSGAEAVDAVDRIRAIARTAL